MKRNLVYVGSLLLVAAFMLSACGPAATPQVIVQTVEVPKVVAQTVVVKETVAVEKQVEKEVVVTPTPALPAEPVELTVRAFSFQLKPDRGRAGDQLRAWAAAHPNVKLNVQSVDDYGGDVLANDVAAGTAPDLVFAEAGAVQPLLTSGKLLDLSPWYDVAALEKDYLPDYWNNFMAYDGKLYGIYQDTEARVVNYRADFLAEAGMEAPANGWTYAEMRDYAKKLTTPDHAGVCIGKEGYIELAMVVANGLNFGKDFTIRHNLRVS